MAPEVLENKPYGIEADLYRYNKIVCGVLFIIFYFLFLFYFI